MFIKSITPENYGPFYHTTRLELEDDVTIITGSNDAGKSSLLRLIAMASGYGPERFNEYHANFDRHQEQTGNWADGNFVSCIVEYQVTPYTQHHVAIDLPQETIFRFKYSFGGSSVRPLFKGQWRNNKWVGEGGVGIGKFPTVIELPTTEFVREEIDLRSPNKVENELLKVAFGSAFSFETKLQNASPITASREFASADRKLNEALNRLLPPSLTLKFQIMPVEGVRHRMALNILDKYDGHTPLGVRGRGIQAIVTLIGSLLGLSSIKGHIILLYDEPENSLHPDAQHALRRVLEELGSQPNIQVVYATHSPAMINTWRGRSVRLLQRVMKGERATTVIHNQPIEGNYQQIRTSLGMSPADSLLYAPVLLLVEGITEALCLSDVYQKLESANIAGFEKASIILSQTHLMDGGGDTFKKMCRLAITQGAKPVIFLDGDKEKAAREIANDFPDVLVVALPTGTEFEEIVPVDVYLAALRNEEEDERITLDNYTEWLEANPENRKAFTKKIDHWLFSQYEISIGRKQEVMRRAVEMVPAEQIQSEYLLRLLHAVERRLQEP